MYITRPFLHAGADIRYKTMCRAAAKAPKEENDMFGYFWSRNATLGMAALYLALGVVLALFPGIMLALVVVLFYKAGENLRKLTEPGSMHE